MHMHMRRRMYQTQCPDQLSGKHQSYDKKSVDGRTLQSSKIEAIHCHRRNTYCFTTMCVSHSISVDERLHTYVLEGKANELLAMPKRSQIWIRDIDSDTVCHVMSRHVMEWNGAGLLPASLDRRIWSHFHTQDTEAHLISCDLY